MKKIRATKIRVLFLIITLFGLNSVLSGCWSAHEINKLSIVNVIGIDETDSGELKVTTVIVKPTDLFAESSFGGGNPIHSPFLIQSVTGNSMFEIMEKLSDSVSEKVYLGHLNAIVFGQDIAKNRMKDCLDFFKRQIDFRPNIKVLVTKESAERIVKQRPNFNATLGLELQELIRSSQFATSRVVTDISQFTQKLSENTEDPITGVISTDEAMTDIQTDKEDVTTQGKVNHKGNKSDKTTEDSESLGMQGTAVFKGEHLVGYLDTEETQGLLLLKGDLDSSIITLNCGKKDKGTVGLQVNHSESTFKPSFTNGEPKMDITISVDANIGDYTCKHATISSQKISQLEDQFEKVLQQQVQDVLYVTQKDWQTDSIGFGKVLYHKYPDQWKRLEPSWRNGGLKQMGVSVKIDANIKRFGLTKEAIKVNESR